MRLHPSASRIFHLSLHHCGRTITDFYQNICLVGLPLIFNHKHSTLLSPASNSRQPKISLPYRPVRPPLPFLVYPFHGIYSHPLHTPGMRVIPPYLCDGNCVTVFQLHNGFQLLLLGVPAVCSGAGGLWAIDPTTFLWGQPLIPV